MIAVAAADGDDLAGQAGGGYALPDGYERDAQGCGTRHLPTMRGLTARATSARALPLSGARAAIIRCAYQVCARLMPRATGHPGEYLAGWDLVDGIRASPGQRQALQPRAIALRQPGKLRHSAPNIAAARQCREEARPFYRELPQIPLTTGHLTSRVMPRQPVPQRLSLSITGHRKAQPLCKYAILRALQACERNRETCSANFIASAANRRSVIISSFQLVLRGFE